MLLDTLGASLLGNLLTVKSAIRAGENNQSKPEFLMLPHSLTNFEIQKYYQKKPRFNGAYLRNKLPKIKDETYLLNYDKYEFIGTYGIALYVMVIRSYISTALELNIFQKKLKTKIS